MAPLVQVLSLARLARLARLHVDAAREELGHLAADLGLLGHALALWVGVEVLYEQLVARLGSGLGLGLA